LEIIVTRHGHTTWNALQLCTSDPVAPVFLTDKGVLQAKEVASTLIDCRPRVIFISDLYRTRQTAEIINSSFQSPLFEDVRISDHKTGHEGRPVSEFLKVISHDPLSTIPDGGESYYDVKKRVLNFIDDIHLKYERVLIVTHFIPALIIQGHFLGLDDNEIIRGKFDNCQVVKFRFDGSRYLPF